MVGKYQQFAFIEYSCFFEVIGDDGNIRILGCKPIKDIGLDVNSMIAFKSGIRTLGRNVIDRLILELILIQRFPSPRIVSRPG
jgi:hypothetical protein